MPPQVGQRYKYKGGGADYQFIAEVTRALSDGRAEVKMIQDLGYGRYYGRQVGYIFASENVTFASSWEYLPGQDAPKV